MGKFIDMTGWKMWEHGVEDSRLTVIKKIEQGKHIKWLCKCSCSESKKVIANGYALRSGHTKSCGCLKIEKIVQQGHLNKKYNKYDLSNEFGIGYTLKNEIFYFDLEDYELIKNYCWHMEPLGYLASDTHTDEGIVKMHRLVMHINDSSIHIDHINHNTFDNRKCNLRQCTAAENNCNVEKRIDNSSGYPGVSWHKRDMCWEVHIQVHKKQIYLGRFNNFEDAVQARKEAEEKYFQDFSFINSQEMSTYV